VSSFGAFGSGAAGLALAGPVAQVAGITRVLGAGAAWAVLSSAVVLALPPARAVRWRSGDGRGALDADPGRRGGCAGGGSDHPAPPVP
jgi:hypothetical protein